METRPTDRLEALRRIARAIPGGMALGRWLRRRFAPDMRAIEASQRRFGPALFQPFPDTAEDRYPELFDALAAQLAGIEAPRILSFGCSSGAAVRAMRQRLPSALITGIDANARVIEQARRADRSPLSRYFCAASPPAGEVYDAILALAVFRHGELAAREPDSCAAVLPFSRFAEGLAMLDRGLVPGGVLAIWNAHFRLADTPLDGRYAALPFRMPQGEVQSLLFGPDDRRLHGAICHDALFRKT